jgi:hypothetical protein
MLKCMVSLNLPRILLGKPVFQSYFPAVLIGAAWGGVELLSRPVYV